MKTENKSGMLLISEEWLDELIARTNSDYDKSCRYVDTFNPETAVSSFESISAKAESLYHLKLKLEKIKSHSKPADKLIEKTYWTGRQHEYDANHYEPFPDENLQEFLETIKFEEL